MCQFIMGADVSSFGRFEESVADAGSSEVRAKSENKKLSFAAVHAVAGGAIRDRERKRKRTLCQKPLRHRERAHRTTS
jgi:hypothetical protein